MEKANTAATAVDAPPHGVSDQERDENAAPRTANQARQDTMNAVPDWKRIMALIVIFAIVIVFWMVFHQNGSTLTYWADDNTAWNVSGTISNSINAFWIVTLTFPLIWFWGYLDKRGKEPATPTKMAIGMTLTGLSFLVLWYGATVGENQPLERRSSFRQANFASTNASLPTSARRVFRKTFWIKSSPLKMRTAKI